MASADELQQDVQLVLTQLQLQQQHVRLIQDVLSRSRDSLELVQILHRSLRCVQSSQLLNQQAFETGEEYVYVLELEGDNYYVGYSACLPNRIHQHFVGDGALWTRKHKPRKVVEIVLGDKSVEKKKTLEWMALKGYEKVRGFAWCHAVLDGPPKELNTNVVRL